MKKRNTKIYIYLINERRIDLYRQYQFIRKQKKKKKKGKGLIYNTLKEWIWSIIQNLVEQSSIYKKVIFIDKRRRNEFKSFANAYNV